MTYPEKKTQKVITKKKGNVSIFEYFKLLKGIEKNHELITLHFFRTEQPY